MVSRRKTDPKEPPSRGKPATTPEGRENQLVALAVDLAERQLREGTASAQVISHFLKLGSTREQLEQERLARENILLEAKAGAIANSGRMEELMSDAIAAMRSYKGETVLESEEGYED
jgi:hypothetical protein